MTTIVLPITDVHGRPVSPQPLNQDTPRCWRRFHDLAIFGEVVEDYTQWLLARGFSVATISNHLRVLRRLTPWFLRRGIRSVTDLSLEDLRGVRRYYRLRKRWFCPSIRWLIEMLQEQGRLEADCPVAVRRSEVEAARFAAHLRKDCGLSEGTVRRHCFQVRRFLKFLGADRGKLVLRDLKLPKVQEFVWRMSRHYCRRAMPTVVAALRKFLRFHFLSGTLREPLHTRLDSVRVYRDERLPQALPWAELQRLLRSMDRSTPQGRRDFAILMLASSYGLRCSEVAGLTLDDVDWRARLLRIAQIKTGRKLLLPLTDGVARALAASLRDGRPPSVCRHVFVRVRPPAGRLGLHGVACSLGRAIRATGANIQISRFHSLRHAFALRLLLEGTPLEHISEVLGHRSFHSTSAYLRLDVEDLRQVALPVPKALRVAPHHERASSKEPPACRKCRAPGSVTAPASIGFRSFLAGSMRDFLRLRRAWGRGSPTDDWLLRNLDCFLTKHHAKARVFTAAAFEQWAAQQLVLSPTTRCRWMRFIRKFCLHVARRAPTTFIPDPRTFPKTQPAQVPCLLSPKDVARLLAATHRPKACFSPEHPLRPKTMRLAVLLLYCCGLRRSEVVGLTLADIDLQQRVLRIRHAKFHKSRLVPMSADLSEEICQYLQQRRRHQTPMDSSAPLLWSGQAGGRADGGFSGGGLHFNWRQICRHAGVFNQHGAPPRLHDLRHSFAVEVLQRAYRAGRDPQTTLPRLARYMGHVDFQFTHHYLKFTGPLRRAASERFHGSLARILASNRNQTTKAHTHD